MNYNGVDLLALMPCATKVPLECAISNKVQEICSGGESLNYKVLSNAVQQDNVFSDIASAKHINDLPDIMIAPGFSRFFYKSFVEKFRDGGFFSCTFNDTVSDAFECESICDPDGYYDIIAFNPLVFLYDKTVYKDVPKPRVFSDLLNPVYDNLVAFRGHDSRSFCEGVLFTIYRSFGYDGIKKLGGSVKCRLHPSQMVKLAGSGKKDAPAISVIPLSFAQMVRENENVEIIWPEDGAIVNPLLMLTKKNCTEKIKKLSDFMCSEEIAEIFQRIGFYSVRPNIEHLLPKTGKYQFVGWDFLQSYNLKELLDELNAIMNDEIRTRGRAV